MKKLLGILIVGLLFCTKAYSNEELYWCKNDTWGTDVIHGIPVLIIPQENKMIFLEELKFSNGNSWGSAVGRKDLKITEKSNSRYKAHGPWVDPEIKSLFRGRVDVIFDREYRQLLTKVKDVNKTWTKWFCKKMR